jgi:hypothetical protein
VLRIKNFDFIDGLGTVMNAGERVTVNDYNSIANNIGTNDAISYWRDVDSDGSVTITDLNIVGLHLNHDCGNPEP